VTAIIAFSHGVDTDRGPAAADRRLPQARRFRRASAGRSSCGQDGMDWLECAMAAPPSPPRPDDQTEISRLAVDAQNGNRFAFQQLVTHLEPRIYRMIFYRTRSREDAEDICQDVFLQAYRSLKKLKEPERFASWLFRIAVNRVNDYHRRQKFRSLFSVLQDSDSDNEDQAAPPAERTPDTVETIVRKEFWQKVHAMLHHLSKMEQEVFLLRFLDDLGIKEIAEVLHKSESTVKTHLYRALEKFKSNDDFRAFIKEAQP
jgi:RNA polymerase sigma-70 factor (ECF subfamily)